MELILYLDASVLIPLFVDDALTSRARSCLPLKAELFISNLAALEFTSGLARKTRMAEIAKSAAQAAFQAFDEWTKRMAAFIDLQGVDIQKAEHMLRQLDLALRAPDAMHLALAQRMGAVLLTFDAKMAHSAQTLGMPVWNGSAG